MSAQPFKIDVPGADIDDLRSRLVATRWPSEVTASGWDYGTNLDYLRSLCGYWADGYDWRHHEASLNELPQFRADGIHFLHVRGKGPDPYPLVLTHGWPSSFYELHKVIGPLTDPAAHGADPADAFDVVVPSLPGYAFSDDPRERGWSPRRIARAWTELMGSLGYERFGAHGGDWGAVITALLGYDHPRKVSGIHMTMLSLLQRAERPQPSPEEAERREQARRFRELETGYQAIQGTKPQTLAYGLSDSPAGVAGWIVEKWRAWSDCGGEVESRFTRDELLTNISLYWFTNTIGSSMRIYYEFRNDPVVLGPQDQVRVPAGFSMFRGSERGRDRVAGTYPDLRMWSVHPKGGHFAAMEEPGLLVADIRAFFRDIRTGS